MRDGNIASFDIWKQQLWSTYVRLESTSVDSSFYGNVTTATPESNLLSYVHSTTQLTERNRGHIRSDPQELVLLALQMTGHGFVEQDGRQARLESGDFAMYETTRPYKLYFDAPFDQLMFRMPRPVLERRLSDLSSMTARRFHGQSGAVQVATSFVLQLAKNAHALGNEGLDLFMTSAADLISNAVRFETFGVRNGDALRLERLQMHIKRHLRDEIPDFEVLASMEGVSLRTLNRLFQSAGTTPRRWILEQRLQGVADDLRATALRKQSITGIAFSWGFNDLSHFNRAFSAKFGISPTAMRLNALR